MRPINIILLRKLLARVLCPRLSAALEPRLLEWQCGFRPGGSPPDQLAVHQLAVHHVMRLLEEIARERLHCCAVDLTAAFDSGLCSKKRRGSSKRVRGRAAAVVASPADHRGGPSLRRPPGSAGAAGRQAGTGQLLVGKTKRTGLGCWKGEGGLKQYHRAGWMRCVR